MMNDSVPHEVPSYEVYEFQEKQNRYCVCVFVINEGNKLLRQLEKMEPHCRGYADIVVADGGSSDGSTEHEKLKKLGVNTLLVKTGPGKLGSQMRMAFDWALKRGYDGVVTMDGNGKDGVEEVSSFVYELKNGWDHIQGSRFEPGGIHLNTPKSRLLGLKLIHAPLMRLASGFKYTDTTNGYRAYSARFLSSDKVALFRNCFEGYELHYYLAIEAARNKFKVKEIPVTRIYPPKGKIPTKISPIKGNLTVIYKLLKSINGDYRVHPPAVSILKRIYLAILAIIAFSVIAWGFNSKFSERKAEFDAVSDSLVLSALLDKEYDSGNIFKPLVLLKNSPEEKNYTSNYAEMVYDSDNALEKYAGAQRSYYHRQAGFAGIFYYAMSKIFGGSRDVLQQISICAAALAMALFLIWVAHEWGFAAYLAGLAATVSCGVLGWASGSLYWALWCNLLPMIVTMFSYMFKPDDTGKLRWKCFFALIAAVFIRCGFGYEYVSYILCLGMAPVVYYVFARRYQLKAALRDLIFLGIAEVIGVALSLVYLAFAVGGFKGLIDSMAYRTAFNIADLSPAMPAIVFESIAKPRTVIFERYLLDFHYWGMPLIAWIGIVLLGGWLLFCRRDFEHNKNSCEISMFNGGWMFLAAVGAGSISWLLLSNPHAYVHGNQTAVIFEQVFMVAVIALAIGCAWYLIRNFVYNYRMAVLWFALAGCALLGFLEYDKSREPVRRLELALLTSKVLWQDEDLTVYLNVGRGEISFVVTGELPAERFGVHFLPQYKNEAFMQSYPYGFVNGDFSIKAIEPLMADGKKIYVRELPDIPVEKIRLSLYDLKDGKLANSVALGVFDVAGMGVSGAVIYPVDFSDRNWVAGVSVHNKDGYNTILLNKEELVKLSGHDTVLINGTRRKILSVDSSNGYMIVDGAKLSGDRNVKLGIHI